MKVGKPGPVLLSVALCALITILVIKLAVTVMGAFYFQPEATISVPDAIAKDDKPPKTETEKTAPVEKTAKIKPGLSTPESLIALQQREIEIHKKEEQLKEKEERLGKLEKEVEQKVKDLLALQKDLQTARTEKQESQNTKVRSLAKIYGTMKPKEAAKLMENLDDKLVMNIISTMTPDEAAAILSLMEVKKAAKISEALSGR
jgi:flagellar motility protein MotE (MotC chaperone)